MIKLIVGVMAGAVTLIASADPVLYKWVGASDASWQALESYTVDDGSGKQVTPSVLPGPLDTVAIIGTKAVTNTVVVPDADLEFVGGLGRVGLNSYAEFVLNIQTDSVFRVAINGGTENANIGSSVSWGRNGRFIKRGPGSLTLEAAQRYSPDSRVGGYLCRRIIVEEGVLSILKELTPAGTKDQGYVPQIEVWKDAAIHIYENDEQLTTVTLDGIYGEGTICCNTATMKSFNLNAGTTSDFAGQLTGNLKLAVSAKGITVNLRGTNNTFRSLAPAEGSKMYSTIGFLGGSVLPTDPDSLTTNKTISSSSWYVHYKYLGGPGGVCAKTFSWDNAGESDTAEIGAIDGGEVGGLTLNENSAISRGVYFRAEVGNNSSRNGKNKLEPENKPPEDVFLRGSLIGV